MYVYVCLSLSICVCVCLYEWLCISVSVCVCVCVCFTSDSLSIYINELLYSDYHSNVHLAYHRPKYNVHKTVFVIIKQWFLQQ